MNLESRMNNEYFDSFIAKAIEEDIGDGDHTSNACIPESAKGNAKLIVKQEGIIAGVDVIERVFRKIDPKIIVQVFISDGRVVKFGDIVLEVQGPVRSILLAERLVLNIIQRMSGIATQTSHYVKKLEGYHTKVLDTRKTTPGMRVFEKEAVRIGGGYNHRMGLYDMIMIKDNHIDYACGIKNAIISVNEYLKSINKSIKIEIEARSIDNVKTILAIGNIDRIMFDNFNIEDTKKAVLLVNGKYETESSGGIDLNTIVEYAKCGVDFISVGALTHQIKSLDISLKADIV